MNGACYKFNDADLGCGPTFPVFFHLRTTNFPGPDSITRSEHAQQRRKERAASKNEGKQYRRSCLRVPLPAADSEVAHLLQAQTKPPLSLLPQTFSFPFSREESPQSDDLIPTRSASTSDF